MDKERWTQAPKRMARARSLVGTGSSFSRSLILTPDRLFVEFESCHSALETLLANDVPTVLT